MALVPIEYKPIAQRRYAFTPPDYRDTLMSQILVETIMPFLFSNSKPSETVWIDDGDIVLWAENTLFRIKRSQLELHSAWWKEILDLHVRACRHKTSDGFPIIKLAYTALDLEHWLAALHDIQETPRAIDTLDDFRRAASIAYISLKYQSGTFFCQALACMQPRWPSDLERWKMFVSECETIGGGLTGPYLAVHPARVIFLANLTGQHRLLPAAYHLLVQMAQQEAAPPYDLASTPIWIPFFRYLMIYYKKLQLYYAEERRDITYAFVTTIEDCTSAQRSGHEGCPESCSDKVKRLYNLDIREYYLTIRDMLVDRISDDSAKLPQAIFTYTEDFPSKYGLCQSCSIALDRQREHNFQRIWSNLPIQLGLGPWESVQGVRFSA
ncbi:hypothetical protein BU17DRAFT_69641 [Hysterangium stoloniferum]|nr:hypothetical protein BU17DRAFT_69641 [Hysterangium stoloniferum]